MGFILWIAALAPGAWAFDGAAEKVDITPDLRSEKVWLAGYGISGRAARGVHDPLYARVLLLKEGRTRVAIVGVDLLGMSRNDVEDLRRLAGYDQSGRSLFVAATHTHSGPDTLGFWGPHLGSSGIDAAYLSRVKLAVADSLRRLEGKLRPLQAVAGRRELNPGGLCRDARDPQVIDPDLNVLKLSDAQGTPLATIVNWSCHPTVLGYWNREISADYPGYLCAKVERRGGVCLFLNGMIGGHLRPDVREQSFAESRRIGEAVADAALAVSGKPERNRPLNYHSTVVRVPIENSRFLLALSLLTSGHHLFDSVGRTIPNEKARWLALRHLISGITDANRPWIETEVALVDIGPARILGFPAEVFPEIAIGGYDGRYAFDHQISSRTTNPPDLSLAPRGPYLRDQLKTRTPMLVGLANDELGYLVPLYDFKVRDSKFMLPRYPGHYEETFSIGPTATTRVTQAATHLLEAFP